MYTTVLPLIVGAICLLIALRRHEIARVLGLVDRPDGTRKLHDTPTPIIGGLMFLACTLVLLGRDYVAMLGQNQQDQRLYLVAAIGIPHCILGMTDDRYSVPGPARLIYSLSLTGAILATDRSLVIHDYYFSFGLSFRLGSQLSYLLTVLFIVGFVYAVNMIDGLNGVLAIYALVLTFFFSIWLFHGNEVYFLCAIATLFVFLAFNLSGAIFAGDGGSYLVGASAAVLFLDLYGRAFRFGSLPIDMIAVVTFVPVVDAIRVSVTRLWRGVGMFAADRNHLHHVLSDRFGPIRALAAYSFVVAVPIGITVFFPFCAWLSLVVAIGLYGAAIYAPRSRAPSRP